MKGLRLAPELVLPLEAVTQTFAYLAKRGSGKTYTVAVLMEEMVAAGLPVVALDPVGVLWGLRAAADGKGPGLPVVIFGGDHGDVPLEPGAGAVVADFLIEARRPAVLDMSLMRKGEQSHFVTDLAERLYHKNREPMHMVLDEADLFAPQRPMPGEQRMLGAMEDLVRRGRARGLGVTLITQRPAVLHKDVLTQVEVLVCLRLIAPQDRAAVDAWVKVHGTPEQRDELMASLPSLPIGTAWFWSPGWLDLFRKVKIRKRTTFDSSATPVMGARAKPPAELAPVDIEQLKGRIASTIEKAKADDPKLLRKRIAELEREAAKKAAPAPPSGARVEVRLLGDLLRKLSRSKDTLDDLGEQLAAMIGETDLAINHAQAAARAPGAAVINGAPPRPRAAPPKPKSIEAPSGEGMSRMDRRFLIALAQYPQGRTRQQVLTLAGYADSGPVSKSFAHLRANGWIVDDDRLMKITPAGVAAAGDFEQLPTGDALIDYWVHKLNRMAARFLFVLAENRGSALSRTDLLAKAAYADSGPVSKALALLRRLDLMKDDRTGLALNEETFS